ncbi:MAG: hypothetical protein ABIH66_02830 [bacterium]
MSDDHTLANSTIRSLDRIRDTYRVHSSTKKDKKEDRKKREKEFRELLEQGAGEAEEFPAEKTFEETIRVGADTMLNNLSAGAGLVNIEKVEEPEEKKAEGEKESEKEL